MMVRRLAAGLLFAVLAVTVASAATATPAADSQAAERGVQPVVQEVQTAPNSKPGIDFGDGSRLLGGPGSVLEAGDGSSEMQAMSGQRDTPCPDNEPCGP